MSQDFGHSKRRIQEAKKKKREEKRLKKLSRDAAPATEKDANSGTPPAETPSA